MTVPRLLIVPLVGRSCLVALGLGEETLLVEGFFAQQHEVDRTAQFGRQDRECLALAVLRLQARQIRLGLITLAQKQHGRFRESPLQMAVASSRPGMAVTSSRPGIMKGSIAPAGIERQYWKSNRKSS